MSIIYKSQFAPPIAFWTLDDSSFSDSSGNGYTLTNNGVTINSGKINNCAVFNGEQYLSGPASLVPSGDFTVSLWVNVNDFGSGGTVFESDGCFNVYLDNGGISVNDTLNTNEINTVGSFSTGTWYHLCIVNLSGTTSVYVDGSFLASTTQTLTLNGTINLGAYVPFGILQYNGSIDAVGVWNYALNQQQINALYNNGNGTQDPNAVINTLNNSFIKSNLSTGTSLTNELLAFYNFDGDINDSSGNGIDLIDVGGFSYSSGKIGSNSTTFTGGGSFSGQGIIYEQNLWDSTTGNPSYSYSMWYRNNSTNGNGLIFGCWVGYGTKMLTHLAIDHSTGYLYSNNKKVRVKTSDFIVNSGTWYYLTLTYNGVNGITKIYVNGVEQNLTILVNNPNFPFFPGLGGFGVGCSATGAGGCEYGDSCTIDSLGIWGRILTLDEIQNLYNNGTGQQYPFEQQIQSNQSNFKIISNNVEILTTAECLVVAGGGAGGVYAGGGAGGVVYDPSYNFYKNSSYTITVGDGGDSTFDGTTIFNIDGNGKDSSIKYKNGKNKNLTILAYGGGAGATIYTGNGGGAIIYESGIPGGDDNGYTLYKGASGGSGGGTGGNNNGTSVDGEFLGGLGVVGQGYNGGSGGNISCTPSGAGGGAGGAGTNAWGWSYYSPYDLYGGIGIINPIIGSNVGQFSGGNYWIGGGGAGATNGCGYSDPSAGGLGGGGSSEGFNSGISATNGLANHGGGGGGGMQDQSGAGGSGVVVIKYNSPTQLASGGTVTSYVDGLNTYWIHTFTSSGTFTT
jgi:hypothetical protein